MSLLKKIRTICPAALPEPEKKSPSSGGPLAKRRGAAQPEDAPEYKYRRSYGSDGLQDGAFSASRMFYYVLFALLFFALYLSFILMRPFLDAIILGCIFTALCHPIYARILPYVHGRGYVASALTIILMLVVVVLPLIYFISHLIPQASHSIRELSQWVTGAHLDQIITQRVEPLVNWLDKEMSWIDLKDIDFGDIRGSIAGFSKQAGQRLLTVGTGIMNFGANFLLMLVIIFFLLKDGESMVNTVKRLTPLHEDQKDRIIRVVRRMAGAVLVGGFVVATAQGIVGGIGLAIVGIPALFWGTVMVFAALVPIVGTGLVWGPAVVYLIITEQYTDAAFLAAWCGVLVTSIDSFLRPIIMRGSSKISLLFLFMSVLGGIKVFGMVGIIYGPIILSFVGAMIGIYSEEYAAPLRSYNRSGSFSERFRKRMPRYPRSKSLFK